MKRILVPTDFSHVAENALHYAIEIASEMKSELYIYHAYDNSKRSDYKWISRKDDQSVIEELEEKMRSLELKYEKIIAQREILFKTKVEKQPISTLFSEIAEKLDIDLVIMGSKGASSEIEKFIFGSVAARALDEAKTPIIIVPPHKSFLSLDKIVLASDLNNVQTHMLNPLKELALNINIDITILNINSGETNKEGLQNIQEYLSGVKTIYKKAPFSDSINDSINDFIEKNKCDLLCMIRRNRGFFESLFQASITKEQLYNTPIPLMVLPQK